MQYASGSGPRHLELFTKPKSGNASLVRSCQVVSNYIGKRGWPVFLKSLGNAALQYWQSAGTPALPQRNGMEQFHTKKFDITHLLISIAHSRKPDYSGSRGGARPLPPLKVNMWILSWMTARIRIYIGLFQRCFSSFCHWISFNRRCYKTIHRAFLSKQCLRVLLIF